MPFDSEVSNNFIFFISADFSYIFNDDGISLQNIIHKAVIEVDEVGSKAAAFTGLDFGVKSIAKVKNPWIFDRPFLYAIMDKKYMFPLFVGRVVDPSGQYELSSRELGGPGEWINDQ